MQFNDIVNAGFEIGCGFFCWMNVVQVVRDKDVKGISWTAMIFFCFVAMWNLYYYPSLGQRISFWASLTVLTANVAWVFLALYYIKRNQRVSTVPVERAP